MSRAFLRKHFCLAIVALACSQSYLARADAYIPPSGDRKETSVLYFEQQNVKIAKCELTQTPRNGAITRAMVGAENCKSATFVSYRLPERDFFARLRTSLGAVEPSILLTRRDASKEELDRLLVRLRDTLASSSEAQRLRAQVVEQRTVTQNHDALYRDNRAKFDQFLIVQMSLGDTERSYLVPTAAQNAVALSFAGVESDQKIQEAAEAAQRELEEFQAWATDLEVLVKDGSDRGGKIYNYGEKLEACASDGGRLPRASELRALAKQEPRRWAELLPQIANWIPTHHYQTTNNQNTDLPTYWTPAEATQSFATASQDVRHFTFSQMEKTNFRARNVSYNDLDGSRYLCFKGSNLPGLDKETLQQRLNEDERLTYCRVGSMIQSVINVETGQVLGRSVFEMRARYSSRICSTFFSGNEKARHITQIRNACYRENVTGGANAVVRCIKPLRPTESGWSIER